MRAALAEVLRSKGVPAGENAGLILDRYALPSGRPTDRLDLFKRVCDLKSPRHYAPRFQRWRSVLQAVPHTRMGEFGVVGRLAVGLGAESVHEVGLTLQKADGTPYLPGSALKGLARQYASHGLEETAAADVLFGTVANAGYVVYFDAWYVPGSAPGDQPLALDTITVHHPRYYSTRGRRPPWDLDNPVPVPFLSARGRFLVAVRGPDDAWAEFALAELGRALADWGAGAKTSSGYGRLEPVSPAKSGPPAGAEQRREHPLVQELRSMPTAQVKPGLAGLVERARRLNEPDRSEALRGVAARLEDEPALLRWARDRTWFAAVEPYLSETSR